MNVGTVKGGGLTRVGDHGFFMNNSHVGHDCIVGNNAIFATSATLGGHCEIGDFVYIGGLSAVHQFTRIGSQVMVGGVCGIRDDVIPYGLVNGQYAVLEGLNVIGMRRRKFTRERLAIGAVFLSGSVPWARCLRRASGARPGQGRRGPGDCGDPCFHCRWQAPAAVPSGRRQVLTDRAMTDRAPQITSPVGLIAAGGAMPFAVADALLARGVTPVLFAIRGACDPNGAGPLPSLLDLDRPDWPRQEAVACRGLSRRGFIGALVRPALSEIRIDLGTLRVIGNIWDAFRGGDDHLLSGIGRIFERDGFRMLGIKDVAPDLLMPEGGLTRAKPDQTATSDIARGREVLRALGSVRYRTSRGRDRRTCGRGRRHRRD